MSFQRFCRLVTCSAEADFGHRPRPQNPLSFDLYAGYDGNLMLAAEQVSGEILSSSESRFVLLFSHETVSDHRPRPISASINMPSILDLRTQIGDRINRLKSLIDFIGRNGLLGKLSQSSRRKISWDMEKLRASADLWTYQNARMRSVVLPSTSFSLCAWTDSHNTC